MKDAIPALGAVLAGTVAVFGALGCQPSDTERTADPAATEAAPAPNETAVEVAAAPPLPTHWTNSEPIGNGEGPVTGEDLLAAPANPEEWLSETQ